MNDIQPICITEEKLKRPYCFNVQSTGRRCLYALVVVILAVALALAIYLPLTLRRKDSPQVVPDSGGACPTGYTGQFCNEPVCEGTCYQGTCVGPNTCMCDEGWSGQQCETAICETPCTDHGSCTSPGTCTCDVGWHGLICEMPFSPGFQPQMSYVYDITLSYAMETEIEMNTNEMNASKEIDSLSFLSSVNIKFSVSSVLRKTSSLLALLKIVNVTCISDVKNQTENLTCDEDSKKALLQINLLFSQNLTTGKILEIYYNASTEFEAVFVARILRFIDCEVLPWTEKDEKVSNVNGQRIITQRIPSKSPTGMQCFDFKRTARSDNITTNREEKRICMGKTGIPENISMSEVFRIGQDVKQDDAYEVNSRNLSFLPTVKGRVTAFGSLISMNAMTNSDLSEGRLYIQDTLDTEYIKSSIIDELATKNINSHKEYDETNVFQDIDTILNHPYPNQRLSLGLDLAEKSKTAIPVIRKLVFSNHKLDRESRSLLIAILGASNTFSGQKSLLEILDAEEMVENDHYIALGSVPQLTNISEDVVSVVRKVMDNALNEDLKTRSILVLGVLGSKGLQHRIVPILTEKLSKKDIPHNEKCALISALGNTHSENAFEPLSKLLIGNETYYKVLGIRALRNIPGRESYRLVLERLLNTRNKKEAMQCIKTLGYKKKWIKQNDLSDIIHIARESKDSDFLSVVQNLIHELKKVCEKEQGANFFHINALEIEKLTGEIQNIKANLYTYDLKRETQNFGASFRFTVDSGIRGNEYDFDANADLNMKLYGNEVNLVRAGSANGLSGGTFKASVFLTLNIFGFEYDMFMRSWERYIGIGVVAGNPCQADNTFITYTPYEYHRFRIFNFLNGITGFSFIRLKFVPSGRVSLGFGFNVVGNNGDSWPTQINVGVSPQAAISMRVSIGANAALLEAGVQGDVDIVSGGVQSNVAFNLRTLKSCHRLTANVEFLRGSISLYIKIGYLWFSKRFTIKLYDWNGFRESYTVHQTYCCQLAFLTHMQKALIHSEVMSSELNYTKTISDTISLLIAVNRCFQIKDTAQCPTELIQHLQQEGVYVFNISMSKKLNEDNNLFFQRKIFPIVITGFGQWYGLNKMGELVELNEIGQLTKLKGSVSDLLDYLAYEREYTDLTTQRNTQECVPHKKPSLFNIQERTKILDLRPYCLKMRAVCENIRIGKRYHSDVMTFTENRNLIEINNKQACSSYIRTNGIRYPFYCEAYPFSFSLQGGIGATVIKANVMEKSVKMEAVQKFIKEFGVKGGDSFVVIV